MKYRSIFFLTIILCSCAEKQTQFDFLNCEIKTVKSKLYGADLLMKYCDEFDIIHSNFYFTCAGEHRETLIVREADGKEVGLLGREGGGPGEYGMPLYAGHSENGDTIYIYDLNKQNMLVYAVHDHNENFSYSFVESIQQPEMRLYINVKRLKNGYYVGLPMEAKATENLLVLFDSRLNIITTFASSPIQLMMDYRDFKISYNNSRIAVYENSVFFAGSNFGYVAGYDISEEGNVNVRFEKILVKPSFHYNGSAIIYDKENKKGFYDIEATKKYLFATYSGKSIGDLRPDGSGMEPETFAVFNHDGELISRIKINNKGFRIAVSEDEKRLYLCTRNPEFDVEMYEIKDLVK